MKDYGASACLSMSKHCRALVDGLQNIIIFSTFSSGARDTFIDVLFMVMTAM